MSVPRVIRRNRSGTAALAAAIFAAAAGAIAVVVAHPAAAAAGAGATLPFTSYEAEAGTLGGGATAVTLTAAPTTQYSSAALEASGHAYVHLAAGGQSVQWTCTSTAPSARPRSRTASTGPSRRAGSSGFRRGPATSREPRA